MNATNTINSIEYKGKIYPLKYINLKGEWGEQPISTSELGNLLINKETGTPVSKEAKKLDEQIFFYVEPHEIGLSDSKLRKIILSSIE